MTIEGDVYHQLFDDNPRPLFVSDSETMQLLAVNRAACTLYGWSRDELLAMTLRDIRPPEERAWFEASFADTEKDRSKTYSRFGRHRAKDGRILDVILEITHLTFTGRRAALAVITDITGIGEAERRFRLLVEHSADGISLTNGNYEVEYLSPGGRRILGYDEDRELAPSEVVVHPDDRARWTPPDPGNTQHFISRIRHRDGAWRWIESATTNLTHDSAIRAYVTNYRDISERVEARRRLEFLLSATSAVTYTTRIDTLRATYMGANVREVLGYEPDDFCNQDGFWRTNIHPEDWPVVEAAISRITDEDSHTLCYRFKHADGAYRWMRDACRVVRTADKVEIVGFWIDITDQVSAQDTVKRSEKKFRTLIERAPIATFVHANGRFVYVNAAAVSMLGHRRPEEIVGRAVLDYVHPHDRETLKLGAFSDLRIVRSDGSVFVLEGTAMQSDFDGVPSYLVMGHDVTERDALFARIAMADRMLSIGTLAAGVAHEINNPLAYIAANLELLAGELPNIRPSARSRLTDATLQCLVTDAREGVARVSAIVRDLRSLSRPVDREPVPVDVVDVLASSIKMTQNEIRHRARVVQSYEDALPRVEADPSRLGQVFVNLLLNAAQAIIEGDADRNEIRISARAIEGRVCIEIADTGSGIPEPILGRIFDPFFTTKAPGGGTGLGLAISHQIVRSLGGEIAVESRPGAGSAFRVMLPIATGTVAVAPAVTPAGTGRRILLVDDEPAVGRSLQMLLAPETEVIAVLCAEDALARLARGEHFDAIVCDLMMPQSTGMQLYAQLAQVAPACLDRIIFMTGGAFTPQARQFLDKLDRPHLEKPFSERDLREAIARVTSSGPATS